MAPPTTAAERAQLREALDIDGTNTDINNVSIPRVDLSQVTQDPSKLEALVGADQAQQVSAEIRRLEQSLNQVNENVDLLSGDEFNDWKGYITARNQELVDALANNDAAKFKEVLEKFNSQLSGLSQFFNEEIAQGLVATHAESGVRVYVNEGSVFVCTPDKEAFGHNDPEKLRSIESKVEGGKGILYVPEGGNLELTRTEYQDEQPLSNVSPTERAPDTDTKLLACRLDQLTYNASAESYSVVTHVRRDNEMLERIRITFTRAQALSGDLRNAPGFGNNGEQLPGVDPSVRELVIPEEGEKTQISPQVPSDITANDEDLSAAAPGVAAVRTRVRTAGVTRPGTPAPGTVSTEGKVLQTIDDYKKITSGPTDTPERMAKVLDDIDQNRAVFNKAYEERLAELEEARTKAGPRTEAGRRLSDQIDELKEVKRNGIRLERRLLRESWSSADEAGKAKLALRAIDIADEVNRVYEHDISRCATEADAEKIRLDQKKFNDGVRNFKKEYGNWRQRFGTRFEGINSRLKAIGEWFSSRPGLRALYERITGRSPAKALERTNAALNSGEVSTLEAKELSRQLRRLSSDAKICDRRIAAIEEQLNTNPTTELQTELKTLKEARARSALRQKAILERQLETAKPGSRAARRINTRLNQTMADEIDDAYRHLETEGSLTDAERTARDNYRAKRTTYEEGQTVVSGRRGFPGLRAITDEVHIATRELETARAAFEAAPEATAIEQAQKTQLKARLRYAEARKTLAERRVVLAEAENALNLDPENAELKTKVNEAKTEFDKAETKVRVRQQNCKVKQSSVLEAQIDDLDTRIASATGDEQAKLVTERENLVKQKTQLDSELSQQQGETARTLSQRRLADINNELKEIETKLKTETDATAKKTLEDRRTQLHEERTNTRTRSLQAELDATKQAKTLLQDEVTRLKARLDTLDEGSTAYKACKSQIDAYTKQMEGLDRVAGYIDEQSKLVRLQHTAQQGRAQLPKLQSDLDALLEAEKTGELTARQKAQKTSLERQIKEVGESEAAYNSASRSWRTRISNAKQQAGRMLRTLRQQTLNPMRSNSVLHTRIDAPGRWMERNPMKAAFVAAAVTEAFHGLTTADMDDDAVHTFMPSLLYTLEKPLDSWGVELEAMEFTTQEGGEFASRMAEVTSRVGNVGMVMGGIKLGQMGLMRVPGGQMVLRGLGSRFVAGPLTFVGSAYFGYAEFADYNNWINDTPGQATGRVMSPILMGAAAGSFFGPPGAAVGAVAGAVGEVAGCVHALHKIDADIKEEWERKGVRDSIRAGMEGYLLPPNHPEVLSRPPLTDAEKSMLDDMSKELTLRKIFGVTFDQSRYTDVSQSPDVFSAQELRDAGFIPPEDCSTDEERKEAAEHNWERLNELYDNKNPLGWAGPQMDELLEEHPAIGRKFRTAMNTSYNHYRDLYKRSTRIKSEIHLSQSTAAAAWQDIKYNHWASPWTYFGTEPETTQTMTSTDTDERTDHIKKIAQQFRQRFEAKEQSASTEQEKARLAQEEWQWLERQFGQIEIPDPNNPGQSMMISSLHTILGDPDTRASFLRRYNYQSERRNSDGSVRLNRKPLTEYSMWTNMGQSETGSVYLNTSMQDKFVTDQIDAALQMVEDFEIPGEE